MKHIVKLITLALVTLGVSGGLWYYLNTYLSQSKAATEVAKVRLSPTTLNANGGDEVRVDVILSTNSSTNTNLGISGVDLAFINTGSNLEFLYAKSTATLPVGFDEFVLNEAAMTSGMSPKQLKRLSIIAKKPSSQLQKSILIPLYFKVLAGGATTSTKLSIQADISHVVGPPNQIYTVSLDSSASDFTVGINNFPPANPVANTACDAARNASRSNCGKGIALTWSDTPNEEGYKIYRNSELVKTVGKDSTTYSDPWCANFNTVSYSIVAYNAAGSTSPSPAPVSCACQVCPPEEPPAPSPMPNPNSADLIFRVIFPDVDSSVNVIPDVKITLLDDAGQRVCPGDTDCAKVVSFTRVNGARVFNTFQSPRMAYNKMNNQGYSVLVKQNHTVRQVYKHVFLKTGKVLFCIEGNTDSGCGELIGAGASRPLFSGDLNASNGIDILDAEIVNVGAAVVNTSEGDLNFDTLTNDKDLEIVAKNLGKKGM